MQDKIQTFLDIVKQSRHMVFFGGAGVATESGIPDFRSADGLYRQKYPYPPETMLSHSFYVSHPEEFFDFYRSRMICCSVSSSVSISCLITILFKTASFSGSS